MQEYANHVALYGIIYILFEKHLREKQVSVYIMKPCGEIGQGFEESLRGGKLVLTALRFTLMPNVRFKMRISQNRK